MSFVEPVTEDQASPALRQLYARIKQAFGFLPNYFLAMGRSPACIEAHLAMAATIMEDGALSRMVKEQLGMVVSGLNTSSYCIAAHMELLRNMGVEKALSRKLATDYPNAPFGEKEQALFRFADKLTRKTADVDRDDIEALKSVGWDEPAIFEAVLAIAWLNFINRVSIGLGVVADF
jgi:uncharacterized peroxidase-related enzyme